MLTLIRNIAFQLIDATSLVDLDLIVKPAPISKFTFVCKFAPIGTTSLCEFAYVASIHNLAHVKLATS